MFLRISLAAVALNFAISSLAQADTFAGMDAEKTSLSSFVRYLQKNYADKNRDYPIHILDRDELDFRIARAGAFGEAARDKRVSLIRDYFQEKTGVPISHGDALNFEAYAVELKNSAYSLPLFQESAGNMKHKVCIVFPTDASSNQRFESERVLGLTIPGVYNGMGFDQLRTKLSFGELRLFSLVHELGHCFDTRFMVKSAHGFVDPHNTHQAESFAEVFAALVLAKEGMPAIAERRGIFRTLYSRKVGEFLTRNPQNSLGDPNYIYGGLIYHLAPVLSGARELIELSPVMGVGLPTIVEKSFEITSSRSLAPKSFFALGYAYQQGRQVGLDHYRDLARKHPDLFSEAHRAMAHFYEWTDSVLASAFNPGAGAPAPSGQLSSFQTKDLCELFLRGDADGIRTKLETLRLEVSTVKGSLEQQKERAQLLKQLYPSLQSLCR